MPVVTGVNRGDLPTKPSVVPKGTYRLRIAKAGLFTVEDAKAKKWDTKLENDMVELDCVIQDEGEFFGRHVFDSLPVSGQFRHRLGNLLEAIDYSLDKDLDTDDLVDAEVYCAVRIQPAKGEYDERNRLGKFISVNEFDAQAQEELEAVE